MQHPGPLPESVTRHNRTLVMGIVNVTPDSFSDGGDFFSADAAITHGKHLLAQGADLLDVGGESTRPGAARVAPSEEIRRIHPVVSALAATGAVVSIDTTRAEVAQAALAAGAAVINDVSGGLADPEILQVAAQARVPYVLMHWRGHATVMDGLAHYEDVVGEVLGELRQRVDAALAAGIAPEQLIVDPGLGFAKKSEANWPLLRALPALRDLGFPVLVGASRKRFLGQLLGETGRDQVAQRDHATAAISALAAAHGAWAVRVHDAASSLAAVQVAQAWANAPAAGVTLTDKRIGGKK